MVAAANEATRELLLPSSLFRYAEDVLEGYARLLQYTPALHGRAVPFECDELAASQRTCKLHRSGAKPGTVPLGETQCFFRSSDGQRHHTLYEASLSLPTTTKRVGTRSKSVVQAMQH